MESELYLHCVLCGESYTVFVYRHAATAPTQRNDVNDWVFLNYNFSKEQGTLLEDDRMIETCRSVLSVLMWILDH